jgi:hypothetical protein
MTAWIGIATRCRALRFDPRLGGHAGPKLRIDRVERDLHLEHLRLLPRALHRRARDLDDLPGVRLRLADRIDDHARRCRAAPG